MSGDREWEQIIIPPGSRVEVILTLSATAPTEGNLELEVRRGAEPGAVIVRSCFFHIQLVTFGQEMGGCFFLPDGGEYFIWVYWDGQLINDPSDHNNLE